MEKIAADGCDADASEPLVGARSAVRTPRANADNDESDYRVVEKILTYDERKKMFEVKWLGYEETTMEPPGHLRYNQMVDFFRRKRVKIPGELKKYRTL